MRLRLAELVMSWEVLLIAVSLITLSKARKEERLKQLAEAKTTAVRSMIHHQNHPVLTGSIV